jgi:ferritin-like metal-binding protein YciE
LGFPIGRLLGEDDAANLLEETLSEEKATDEKLSQVAESAVNVEESEEEHRKAA